MELYDNRAFQVDEGVNVGRALTSTSGNARLFVLAAKPIDDKYESSESSHSQTWQPRLPSYRTTVPSNDRRVLQHQKLKTFRRLKRRIHLAQKYLQHPKFINFKSRARKDTDKKTNEVIWDEETELAFQNAVINIPAMGRRKKSQHGKSFGRNELIQEWIKQETGRARCRKQVSSHMQTLDNLFKPKPPDEELGIPGDPGVPEWRLLNKGTDDSIADSDGPQFYENSIADMVRHWRSLQVDLNRPNFDFDMVGVTHSSSLKVESAEDAGQVNGIEFEMWVSLPGRMEEALHRYTRMQSSQTTTAPIPLENMQNWRASWPELGPLLENTALGEPFDIIMMDTSLELMLDFPPPGSKLGINLRISLNQFLARLPTGQSQMWNCTTSIFQRGKLDTQVQHTGCDTPEQGIVKLFLESKWWAEQFTRLTEKRRHAIDTGNDAAVTIADEAARNYLKNLKIMQKVTVSTDTTMMEGTPWAGTACKERVIAVLLWSFSPAATNFVGTTTWRRLIPPPPRITTNSPFPPHDIPLPPLNLDTTLEGDFDDETFQSNNVFVPHAMHPIAEAYEIDIDEELCQDGFMVAAQQAFASGATVYPTTLHFDPLSHSFNNSEAFHSNMQHVGHSDLRYNPGEVDSSHNLLSTNLFEAQSHFPYGQHIPLVPSQREDDTAAVHHTADTYDPRQALISAHEMLQSQIQDHQDLHGHPSNQETTHQLGYESPQQTQAQSVASPTLQTGNDQTEAIRAMEETTSSNMQHSTPIADAVSTNSTGPYSTRNIPIIPAPTPIRPHLQHHHSFAGILETEGLTGDRHNLDDTVGHDFSLLLDSLDASHDTFFEGGGQTLPTSGLAGSVGLGIIRPYTQPPPVAMLGRGSFSDEIATTEREQEVMTTHTATDHDAKADPNVISDIDAEAEDEWIDVKVEDVGTDE